MMLPPLLLLIIISSLPLLILLSLHLHRRRRCCPGDHLVAPPDPSALPLQDIPECAQPSTTPPEVEQAEGEEKKRKKKGRKKRVEPLSLEEVGVMKGEGGGGDGGGGKESCQCPYPFSSSASATQRKIKLQYDQLVKSNQAKTLSMAQVGQFVNCLVEARNELQHKSDVIQRSFKIKKALLFKADRSSFDRLCQQIHKLETEHKRLEEDAAVFNLLQEQLKLSPAYKKLLEVGASMEQNAGSDQAVELSDISDISFEELLAQEKKDSFWQKYAKQRS